MTLFLAATLLAFPAPAADDAAAPAYRGQIAPVLQK